MSAFHTGPDDWEGLYERYSDAESRRSERRRKWEEEEAALAEFEAWTRRSTEQLMKDLSLAAEARSEAFVQRTGHPLQVEYPSGPSITLPDGGPEIRFLRLSLRDARVHIYSSHTPGGLVHIHLLPSRRDSLQHNQRLLSEPGAFVVRRTDDSYELRFLAGDPEGVARSAMSLDGLLFKAFRLLIHWANDASVLPAAVRKAAQVAQAAPTPQPAQKSQSAQTTEAGPRPHNEPRLKPSAVTRIAFVDVANPLPGAAQPQDLHSERAVEAPQSHADAKGPALQS